MVIAALLAISALVAGIALATASTAVAQVDDAADCAERFGFARNPVPVAKTADGQQVLASVKWGYSPGLCYLVLDDAAVQALRTNPPTGSAQVTTPADRTAADRCHNAHNPSHGFARNPVPVAKTSDGQQVLASVRWGYTDGLCFLVLDDNALNTLQTIGKVKSYTPGGTLTTISAGGTHWCALRDDQTITCDGLFPGAEADPPDGRFIAVFASGNQSCGWSVAKEYICWGTGGNPFAANIPPGLAPTSLVYGSFHACGLRTDQTIACWIWDRDSDRRGLDHGQDMPPPGQFTALASGGFDICGLRTDRTIACWGLNAFQNIIHPPEGKFTAVSGGGTMCGLRIDQTIACWGRNNLGQADPPNGQFTAISHAGVHGCGLRTDQNVACWGQNASGETDAPSGRFVAVSAGGQLSCGIRADRTIVVCWGAVPE